MIGQQKTMPLTEPRNDRAPLEVTTLRALVQFGFTERLGEYVGVRSGTSWYTRSCAHRDDATAETASTTGANADGIKSTNPRPPLRSGCVGTIERPMRANEAPQQHPQED
jgi:hypothetical protein